jgi:hypothetical protein
MGNRLTPLAETDRQAGRQTGRKMDRQTDRQAHVSKGMHVHPTIKCHTCVHRIDNNLTMQWKVAKISNLITFDLVGGTYYTVL